MQPKIKDSSITNKQDLKFLDLVNQFARDLLDQVTVEEVVWSIINNVIAKLDFEDCVIYLPDEDHNYLIQVAAHGAKKNHDNKVKDAIRIKFGEGIVGNVAKTKKPRIVNDTSKEPSYIVDDAMRLSEVAIPIVHQGELLGVIDSEYPTKGYYTEEHLTILSTVASMAAIKIVQAKNLEYLETQESHFNRITSSANDLIFLVKVEPGFVFRYESVNKTYESLLGIKESDIEGHTVSEVWGDEIAKGINKSFTEAVIRKERIEYEVILEKPDRTVVIQSRVTPYFDENGICVNLAGVARDVTDLKRKEEALRESKEQYENLFESSADVIYIHNFEKITNVNQAFLKQFGYSSKEEILGKQPLETTVHKDDYGMIIESRKKLDRGENLFLPGVRLIKKDGTVFISESHISRLFVNGKPHLQVITRDITERKKAEEALRQSRESLGLASQIAKLGSFEWYPKVTHPVWDEQMHRIFGISLEAQGNRNEYLLSVIHPDDRKRITNAFEKSFDAKNSQSLFRNELRIILKGDRVRHIDSNVLIIRDKEGVPERVIGACRDVTDQRKAEEDKNELLMILKRSEDKFRTIFESAPYPLLLMNQDLEFVNCNRAAVETLGMSSKSDIINRHPWEFSPEYQPNGERSKDLSYKMDMQAFETGRNNFEWADRKGDGSIMYLDVTLIRINLDSKKMLLVHFQDITQKKIATQALKKSKERLRQIIDLVPHFIFSKDIDGRFILVNEAVAKIYNTTVTDIIGKTDADFNPNTEEVEFFRKKDAEVIKSKKAQYNIEEKITLKDGEKRILSATKIPFTTENIPAILGVSVDITEEIHKQEKLEELLRVTNDQNERLQNFAHIVSHNIRSHSANISSLVRFIDKSNNDVERPILFGMLKTSTEKLEETIQNLNEIIDINKKLEKPVENRNLRREVNNTLEILSGDIRENKIDISVNVALSVKVNVIPAYLDSILLNLLSNAIKYRSRERKPFIKISCEKSDDYTVLLVEDNGLGIDLIKNKGKMFGMYKTFHGNEDSRGFGLYITKNQIDAMGGKIEVESKVNKGSTFKVYFA